ncbi:hypothetical protein BGW80DRAFT_1275241 [Lactifluus volemus]|nr:hypothetical protein BGW80DRAFT_1275241 [Lactifluus volemus]
MGSSTLYHRSFIPWIFLPLESVGMKDGFPSLKLDSFWNCDYEAFRRVGYVLHDVYRFVSETI